MAEPNEARPPGWVWHHEHEAQLIARDGLMCEEHVGTPWPHDDCPGPGMSWRIEGRDDLRELLEATFQEGYAEGQGLGEDPPWRTAWKRTT